MEWNPERLAPEDYIELLNFSFGDSWNAELFHWYMQRPFAGRTPDLAVLCLDGKPVSGAAVNYRQLRDPQGRIHNVGVISGAWTHPEARGHGYYTRVMRESANRVATQGCELLLGFVTADNDSSKGMKTAGAWMIPTAYVMSTSVPAGIGNLPTVTEENSKPATLHPLHNVHCSTATGFHYASMDDWTAQILHRPGPVEILRIGDDAVAVIEQTADTDRLQWLSSREQDKVACLSALAARATAAGRQLFAFCTGPSLDACVAAPGLRAQEGFITCLPAGRTSASMEAMLAGPWEVHSGDRV